MMACYGVDNPTEMTFEALKDLTIILHVLCGVITSCKSAIFTTKV